MQAIEMGIPYKIISGRLDYRDERTLLILDASQELYLRFALVELNSGAHIFPESILDDWGREIKDFSIYRWLGENGNHFPRAELFGYLLDGSPVQRFIRELDLSSRFVCYGYINTADQLSRGTALSDGVMPGSGINTPRLISPPVLLDDLIKKSAIRWWSANYEDENQLATIVSNPPTS